MDCTDCGCSILRSEVHPRDFKDLLHLLSELVNQHYMTSVCFIDDSSNKSRQFTSSVLDPKNAESILLSVMSIQSQSIPCDKIKGDMNNMNKEKYLHLMNSLRVDSLCTKRDGVFKCQWSEAFFEALTSEKVVKYLKEFLTTFLNKTTVQLKETIIECEKEVLTAHYKFDNPTRCLKSHEFKGYAATILEDKEEMNGSHLYFFHKQRLVS